MENTPFREDIIGGRAVTSKQRFAGAAALTLCVAAVSACTSSPSHAHPAIFSPGANPTASATGPANGASVSASPAVSPTGAASASASPSASPTASPPASFTSAPTSVPASSSRSYPAAAPQTGGGGTSGLQDGLLFGVGGAAVLAGAGSLALRRKFRALAKRDS